MSDIVALQHEMIPRWASFDEAVFYVLEHGEENYQEMMRGFALDELGYVAEAKEIKPDSESRIKQIKDTVITFIKKKVKEFMALCNDFLQKMKKTIAKTLDKGFYKMRNKIKENVDNLKDKKYGKTYAYPKYYSYVDGNGDNIDELNAAFELTAVVSNAIGKNDIADMEKDIEAGKARFYTAVHAKQGAKESEVRKGLITWFRCGSSKESTVDVDKAYIKAAIEDGMIDIATNYNKLSSCVSTQVKKFKKAMDNNEKQVKADKKNNSSVYGVLMPALRFASSMMMVTQSAFMSVIREKTMKDIFILTRLSTVSTKKKEATNEAAEGMEKEQPIEESSSYQSEIASLFDFSF